ncbi:hypothetical protein GGI04_004318 [Coemansia thaxteri]|nr:hypothetical protein GGI04_004318 [Coemansia thaxteri]
MDTPVFAGSQANNTAANTSSTTGSGRTQTPHSENQSRGRSTKHASRGHKDSSRGRSSKGTSQARLSAAANRSAVNAAIVSKNGAEAEADDEEDVCFICAEPVELYAVGACNHRTCFRCNLRLRSLFKSKACPYCKTEMESVIYTGNPVATYDELSLGPLPYSDKSLNIEYDSKEAYDKSMYMLHFNCPHESCQHVDSDGWKGLKDHVRDSHSLQFCELCLKNKMSFSHEHRLFTKAQLRTHYSRGDGTGFTGHPQCDFCRASFYDNDQLFDHCRHKHEQCFICVRNGTGRHVYFADYQSLEKHFNSDHFPCRHAFCHEKKFVVFENSIDLQGHELEAHGSSFVGQRARREAKQVNLNFQYSSNRGSANSSANASGSRARSSDGNQRPSTMMVNGPDAAGVSIAGRRRPDGFGRVSSAASRREMPAREAHFADVSTPTHSSPEPTPKSLWPTLGPESRSQPQPSSDASASSSRVREKAPLNFGRLSDAQPAKAEVATQPAADEEILASHQELLQRVSAYLSHREQPVTRFRQLTTQFKNGESPAVDYVENCWLLFLTVPGKNAKVMIKNTIKAVAELLPETELKADLLKALSEHRIRQQQFPALTPLVGPTEMANSIPESSTRVLVIKKAPASTRTSGWYSASPAPSVAQTARAGKQEGSSQLDYSKRSASSSSLSINAFPSLGSSSSASAITSLTSQLRISNRVASAGSSGHSASAGGAAHAGSSATPASRTAAPEFPDLPPATAIRPAIVPIDRNASSAWDGSGIRTSDGSSKATRGSKQSRNSKGKQVLFRAG